MRYRIRAAIAVSACFVSSAVLQAQDMEVPVAVQVPILLKVLGFDRQLHVRCPREVVVGVVYQSGNRASVAAKDDAMQAFQSGRSVVDGLVLRAVAIDLDHVSLAEVIEEGTITHLYIAPLRATDVRALASLARSARVTTMTGVGRYLGEGLGLSVGLRGARLRILVNLDASRTEGADFSAELLKLAELFQ